MMSLQRILELLSPKLPPINLPVLRPAREFYKDESLEDKQSSGEEQSPQEQEAQR